MAEISQVQVLDGSVYDLKDSTARSTLENVSTRTPIALGIKSLTSNGGTVTWTSDYILTDSIVHIYSSIYGITATNVSVTEGSLTATFPAASSSYVVNATVDGTATVNGGSGGSSSGGTSGGVTSFNGRTGIVVPLAGDYSYAMISGTPSNATTLVAGLMSADDKKKLDDIETGATKNTDVATIDVAGLMSASDKSKLDSIDASATRNVIDSALSTSSTNAVQNKLVTTSLNTLTNQYSDISGQVSTLSNSVSELQSASKVSSFNGRTGIVLPQTNDYSFSQISGTVALSQIPDVTSKVNDATISAAGLFTAAEKAKLTDIEEEANKTIVDETRSSTSTNPVQNKVIDSALTALETKTTTAATSSDMGMMSAEDKAKLDGIAEGATKTAVDSAFSTTSFNPIANSVVAQAIFRKLETQTLSAGSTVLSWTNSLITDSSLIEVYASIYGIAPTSVTQSGTTVTVVFSAQSSDMDVCIVVKNG